MNSEAKSDILLAERFEDLRAFLLNLHDKLKLKISCSLIDKKTEKLARCEVLSPNGIVICRLSLYKSLGQWKIGQTSNAFPDVKF